MLPQRLIKDSRSFEADTWAKFLKFDFMMAAV